MVHSTVDGEIFYPELAIDGLRQIVIWQEDDDESDGDDLIYASTRCGNLGSWSTPEVIKAAATDGSQDIQLGSPHIVMNRGDDVAHVVFREEIAPQMGTKTAKAWWARLPYDTCP